MQTPSIHPGRRLKKTLLEALLLCAAAAVVALLVNSMRPEGLDLIRKNDTIAAGISPSGESPGPSVVSPDEALAGLKAGNAVFIDARSVYDFRAGHVKGALNRQEKNLDAWMPDFFNQYLPETLLIIYCGNPQCHLARHLALKLADIGYTNIRYMPEGWDAWQANAYPAENEPEP